MRADLVFTHSTKSKADLFHKQPQSPPRNVLPAIGASLSPVNMMPKINHHNAQDSFMLHGEGEETFQV